MTTGHVCVMGAINLDVLTYAAAIPRPGETVLAHRSARSLGGKAANQAVASARMGAATRLIGAVGDDADGRWLLDELRAAGVGLEGMTVGAGIPSGFANICVADGGENAIVVVGGANATLSAERVAAGVAAADVRLVQLESPLPCVEAFLRPEPVARGLRILNAAPALLEARRLFGFAEVLVVNEHELGAYLGRAVAPDPAQATEAARALRRSPQQRVVVTLGAAGLLAVDGEAVIRIEGRRVQAVDTTGAGDCFCGALAAGLAGGRPLAEALERAAAAASISVTRQGAAPSMPTAGEVEAVLSA